MTKTNLRATALLREAETIWSEWVASHPELIAAPSEKTRRQVLHRVSAVYRAEGVLVDLGGGMSIVNGLLATMGMRVHVFDILEYDLGWVRAFKGFDYSKLQAFLEQRGVHFVAADICRLDLREHFAADSLDAVVSHHCLEHLHQSPRSVLQSALATLRGDGILLIEVPNAVNALKRLKVARGITNYTAFDEHFESENFTGHVREYSTDDLRRLMRHLWVNDYVIYGRNWYGTLFEKLGYGILGRTTDSLLRLSPGLCGSLFLRAAKPPRAT